MKNQHDFFQTTRLENANRSGSADCPLSEITQRALWSRRDSAHRPASKVKILSFGSSGLVRGLQGLEARLI